MTEATYVDANVLICAFRGNVAASNAALAVLGGSNRSFMISEYLRLETLPKPSFHGNLGEVRFLNAFFEAAVRCVDSAPEITRHAVELAARYDLAPMDALHVSAALSGQASVLITVEKPSKPLFRVQELKVLSIYQGDFHFGIYRYVRYFA
jgi:predicted nucleic acid-binding protein